MGSERKNNLDITKSERIKISDSDKQMTSHYGGKAGQSSQEPKESKEKCLNTSMLPVHSVLVDTVDCAEIKQERDELKSNLLQLNVSYQKEKKQRKKLLEQLIDIKGNIRVFCRVRPKIDRIVTSNQNHNDEPELMAMKCLDDERIAINDHDNNNKKEFSFDQVYQPNSSQEAIFEDVKPLIQSAVDGYNCCIFAYGQTGSGKTYTMEGSNKNPGVIYRAFDELFSLKKEHIDNEEHTMNIYLSCLEIYNEKIKDLLQPKHSNLKAKLSKCGKKVLVPELTRNEVFDTLNVKDILQNVAYKNRSTGSTDMNAHSSRSHALLFVDIVTQTTSSRLVLIDLAGSERVKKTGVSGAAFDEAKAINKSLSALGNVIHLLQSKHKHIPFRDSQLTYLLYDCLGGNSKALMFCNVSCEGFDVKESINTLQFAHRVRRVQLGEAHKNDNNNQSQSESHTNKNNSHRDIQDALKQKLKKSKADLDEKEKEINKLKMNNRNFKKEINKLMQSADVQSNKNANHHQQRMEFNNLQKEHNRMVLDVEKKEKVIKKLSNEVNEYKHKLKQRKNVSNIRRPQTALPPTTKTLHRSKNARKRKLPSHENTNNNQSKSNDNNGPAMKRRKMNNNNGNYRKNNSKHNQQRSIKPKSNASIPSYLAPTRNSRDRVRNNRNSSRPRSSSIDGKKRNAKNSKKMNAKSNGRKQRNNSMDSVVSVSPAPISKKTKSIIACKPKPTPMIAPKPKNMSKAAAPLTPGSAMEALKNASVGTKNKGNKNKENVTMNDSKNNNGKPALSKNASSGHVPITVSSLQLQSTQKNRK